MKNTVKEHRQEMGYSQERLAQVLGVSRGTVANWENGQQIKASHLMQMVALFACDVNELLGLVDETVAVA